MRFDFFDFAELLESAFFGAGGLAGFSLVDLLLVDPNDADGRRRLRIDLFFVGAEGEDGEGG